MKKIIKGYKVTDSEMKCRDFQFSIGVEYTADGKIICCKNGLHFCLNLIDCFNYYSFDSKNRVFEIEGYGDSDTENDKIAIKNIKLLKELNWYEVLNLVNTGKNNTGKNNTGNSNSGYSNSGDYNSGDYNSGYSNSGNSNSGNSNSGDYNSGDYNSGNSNSGDYNSGNRNSGNRNSGNSNSGDYNSGDYNSGNYNSGYFNNNEPTIRLFGKDSNLSRNEINVPFIYLPLNAWISESSMSDSEKENNPKFHVLKGYLKKLSYKEAWKVAWNNSDDDLKQRFLNLPNFDAVIFEDITGIKI